MYSFRRYRGIPCPQPRPQIDDKQHQEELTTGCSHSIRTQYACMYSLAWIHTTCVQACGRVMNVQTCANPLQSPPFYQAGPPPGGGAVMK